MERALMTIDPEPLSKEWPTPEEMPPLLAVWTNRQSITMVAGVAVIYLILNFVDGPIATIGLSMGLTTGVVIVLGLLLGPIAAWGVALGYVLTDFVMGVFALNTVVGFLGEFILAILAFRLWGSFGIVPPTDPAGNRSNENAIEYGLVAVTATSFVVAVSAWAYLIVGVSTFAATIIHLLPGHLLSALVVGPILLYTVSGFVDRHALRFRRNDVESNLGESEGTGASIFLLVSLGWSVIGLAIGILGQAIELEYPHLLVNRLGRWTLSVLDILGPGGIYLQLFVGMVAIGVCLWGVTRV